jgi:flagellar basal body-associated protein FliL
MICRLIIFLCCAGIIFSCSVESHLSKAKKHIEIAKRKGAVIKPDTIWQYVYDTDTVYNNTTNTYETKHIIKDSFPYTVTNTITSGITRQERKAMQDMFDHLEKMMKLQNDSLKMQLKSQDKQQKQEQKTDRIEVRKENKKSPWIIWGIVAGLLVLAILLFKFN